MKHGLLDGEGGGEGTGSEEELVLGCREGNGVLHKKDISRGTDGFGRWPIRNGKILVGGWVYLNPRKRSCSGLDRPGLAPEQSETEDPGNEHHAAEDAEPGAIAEGVHQFAETGPGEDAGAAGAGSGAGTAPAALAALAAALGLP